MQKVQKTYTPEFKREAVRLAQTSRKPIAQVARELGISDTSIQECAKRIDGARQRSLSRERPSDCSRRRGAPTQTEIGSGPEGA